jgi:hypothetical protein
LAADTPQSLEITELSHAHHLRISILFSFFSFWDENTSGTLVSIKTLLEAEIGTQLPIVTG